MLFVGPAGCSTTRLQAAGWTDAQSPGLGCKRQVLPLIGFGLRLQASAVQAARPNNIVLPGSLDLEGPDPQDASISKRRWEGLVLAWRSELRASAAFLQGVSV